MAVTVALVDAVTGAPSYTGRKIRGPLSAMWFGKTAALPLGARSGVAWGTSTATITVSGTTVTIKPHAGVLALQSALEASVYLYANDANTTLTHAAAHATQARKDLIAIRLDDPAESDGSSVPAAVFTITKGAEDGSNVVPATPARSLALATVNVPVSGGGASTITWTAPYAVAAGGIIPVRTVTERAALAAAYPPSTEAPLIVWNSASAQIETSVDGTVWNGLDRRVADAAARSALAGMRINDRAYQVDTNIVYRYNGTAWKPWESAWTALTPTITSSAGTYTTVSCAFRYKWINGAYFFTYAITNTNSGTASGYVVLPLGVTAASPSLCTAMLGYGGFGNGWIAAGATSASLFASAGSLFTTGGIVQGAGFCEVA